MYVLANYHVKNGINLENIKWAFSFNGVAYWHPLTWLSLMLDCQLFGIKSGPLLLENVAFHILNALLLFVILLRVTGARFKSAAVALLFALHPLNVESVAWLVERKTVLSAFFLMSSLYTYVIYAENKNKGLYGLVLCLYSMGLMAKPIILTVPVLLLILDYWPLKRFKYLDSHNDFGRQKCIRPMNKFLSLCKSNNGMLIVEKLPFFILSIISLLISMLSLSQQAAVINYESLSVYLRISNYFISIVQYLGYIAWPVELSIFYPFPQSIPIWHFLLALIFVITLTFLIFLIRKRRPWLFAGWCWFIIALMPTSGLIQSGLWPALANRFMYIPIIGIFIMVIWEADERLKGRYSQVLKIILFSAMLTYFAFLTRVQSTYFSNSFSLFTRSLEVAGENSLVLNNLGCALASLGRTDEAMIYFAKGMKLHPTKSDFYYNYAICLKDKGDNINATLYFKKAIALNPKNLKAYLGLGAIQGLAGNSDEAMKLIINALSIDQNDLDARNNYGIILAKQGKYEGAIAHFSFVIKRDPSNILARLNLSKTYQDAGLYDEAMMQYETLNKMITKNKGYLYYGIASVYSQQKKFRECENYLEAAQKDGFNVFEYLKSDIRFKNFRNNPGYETFLENHEKKSPSSETGQHVHGHVSSGLHSGVQESLDTSLIQKQ